MQATRKAYVKITQSLIEYIHAGKVANTTCMIYLDEYICYWPGATKKNFHQAMAQCLSEGGTLSNRSPSSSPDKPNIFFDK